MYIIHFLLVYIPKKNKCDLDRSVALNVLIPSLLDATLAVSTPVWRAPHAGVDSKRERNSEDAHMTISSNATRPYLGNCRDLPRCSDAWCAASRRCVAGRWTWLASPWSGSGTDRQGFTVSLTSCQSLTHSRDGCSGNGHVSKQRLRVACAILPAEWPVRVWQVKWGLVWGFSVGTVSTHYMF